MKTSASPSLALFSGSTKRMSQQIIRPFLSWDDAEDARPRRRQQILGNLPIVELNNCWEILADFSPFFS
jgi:hypothetical protein